MDIGEIIIGVLGAIICIGILSFPIIRAICDMLPTKRQIERNERRKLKAEQKRIENNMQEVIYVTDDILKKIKGE